MVYSTVKYFKFFLSKVLLPKGRDFPKYLCSPNTTKAYNSFAKVLVTKPELL